MRVLETPADSELPAGEISRKLRNYLRLRRLRRSRRFFEPIFLRRLGFPILNPINLRPIFAHSRKVILPETAYLLIRVENFTLKLIICHVGIVKKFNFLLILRKNWQKVTNLLF